MFSCISIHSFSSILAPCPLEAPILAAMNFVHATIERLQNGLMKMPKQALWEMLVIMKLNGQHCVYDDCQKIELVTEIVHHLMGMQSYYSWSHLGGDFPNITNLEELTEFLSVKGKGKGKGGTVLEQLEHALSEAVAIIDSNPGKGKGTGKGNNGSSSDDEVEWITMRVEMPDGSIDVHGQLESNRDVVDLREYIEACHLIPVAFQKLSFHGIVMHNVRSFKRYGVHEGDVAKLEIEEVDHTIPPPWAPQLGGEGKGKGKGKGNEQ